MSVERPALSFALRWCSWLREGRPQPNFLLSVRNRAPSFNTPDTGYIHRGRVTFR